MTPKLGASDAEKDGRAIRWMVVAVAQGQAADARFGDVLGQAGVQDVAIGAQGEAVFADRLIIGQRLLRAPVGAVASVGFLPPILGPVGAGRDAPDSFFVGPDKSGVDGGENGGGAVQTTVAGKVREVGRSACEGGGDFRAGGLVE